MQTTALNFPVTVPPWKKPMSVVRVLRRRLARKRVPGPAMIKPQSKWTVLASVVLAVILHVTPVVILQMDLEAPPVEFAQALHDDTVSAVGSDSIHARP